MGGDGASVNRGGDQCHIDSRHNEGLIEATEGTNRGKGIGTKAQNSIEGLFAAQCIHND